jgi:hypothetical protein
MPEKHTRERATRAKRQGKAPSTQAGEYVREEIHHVREGKHGARSAKQAIAIGLSKARRAGVELGVPKKGRASAATVQRAETDAAAGRHPKKKASPTRSRATRAALRHEGHAAASHAALASQARRSARQRSAAERSSAAEKAARTKGAAGRKAAAKKAARTRARRQR